MWIHSTQGREDGASLVHKDAPCSWLQDLVLTFVSSF